jgi:site-specific recombinase XerC
VRHRAGGTLRRARLRACSTTFVAARAAAIPSEELVAKINTTSAEGVRDRALVELLYSSDIRAAELRGLDDADVDLTNCTAIVTGTCNVQCVAPIGKTAAVVPALEARPSSR